MNIGPLGSIVSLDEVAPPEIIKSRKLNRLIPGDLIRGTLTGLNSNSGQAEGAPGKRHVEDSDFLPGEKMTFQSVAGVLMIRGGNQFFTS